MSIKIHETLPKLRKARGLTQEELPKKPERDGLLEKKRRVPVSVDGEGLTK